VYLNNGGPVSTTAAWSSVDVVSGSRLAWGDWDGDGDLDLAVSNRVYENDGSGLSTTAVWTSAQPEGAWPEWGDWDGDGDLDLVLGRYELANRVYENDGTGLSTTSTWASATALSTQDLAWGDWDGDADLDLAVTTFFGATVVYENDGLGSGNSLIAFAIVSTEFASSLAWGDWDGDGDLDLAVGSTVEPTTVYENDGLGMSDSMSLVWSSPETAADLDVAWGDWDGDGDLDLAVASSGPQRVYENDGLGLPGSLTLAWSSSETDYSYELAWGDWDGDGDLDLASTNREGSNRVYENDGTGLSTTAVWSSFEQDTTSSVAWGDWDGDGDLDLAFGNTGEDPERVHENGLVDRPGDLPETSTYPVAPGRPGTTSSAYFFSAAELLTPPVAIQYTLFDEQSDRAWQIVPEYSPNGGGQWFPATESDSDGTTNLAADPFGTPHIFFWDAAADGAYSDNVVFRITLTAQSPDHVGYPLQRGALSSVTSPFRVAVDTDGDHVADLVDNCPTIPNPSQSLSSIGDRAWIDTNGNGLQNGGEPGFANLPVVLYDGSLNLLEIGGADSVGTYHFSDLCPGDYIVEFFLPVGYSFSPPDQGPDDGGDSDVDPVTGRTGVIALADNTTLPGIDAGLVPGCLGPDEPVYISHMELTGDGNNYPVLTFMDPNQPSDVTGYNVYRTDDASIPVGSWPLLASNVVDMDEERLNNQWIDTSGDEPVAGPAWFYQVTAYSSVCSAEGPF